MELSTRDQINLLESRQLELRAIMKKSDEHALKCYKSGINFKETYPEDSEEYEKARVEYNENEIQLAEMYELLDHEIESFDVPAEAIIENQEEM